MKRIFTTLCALVVITLTTMLGTRIYAVVSVEKVGVNDSSFEVKYLDFSQKVLSFQAVVTIRNYSQTEPAV